MLLASEYCTCLPFTLSFRSSPIVIFEAIHIMNLLKLVSISLLTFILFLFLFFGVNDILMSILPFTLVYEVFFFGHKIDSYYNLLTY